MSSLTIATFHTTLDTISVPLEITVEWSKHGGFGGHAGYVVSETANTTPHLPVAASQTRTVKVFAMGENLKAVAWAVRRFNRYERIRDEKSKRSFVR